MSSHDSAKTRLSNYIEGVKKAYAEAVKNFRGNGKAREILDLAKTYIDDTVYYYEIGDYITGLVTVAYAEGLLDALRILGYTDFEWLRKERPKKVVVAGTFDIIHPGHIEFLKFASRYGKVTVIVARDANVQRFKGKKPVMSEEERLKVISAIKYVDRAVLGKESEDIFSILIELKPDIVVLGPDQNVNESKLKEYLQAHGLNVEVIRMRNRLPNYSSSEIVRRIKSMDNR